MGCDATPKTFLVTGYSALSPNLSAKRALLWWVDGRGDFIFLSFFGPRLQSS